MDKNLINKTDISFKRDKSISILVAMYYLVESLNLSIKYLLPLTEQMWNIVSNCFMIFLAFLMLFNIKTLIRRSLKPFIITECCFVILFLISYLMNNAELTLLLSIGFRTLFICIPISFYVFSVKEKKSYYDTIVNFSYIIIFVLLLTVILLVRNSSISNYSMPISYSLLLPILFQLNEFYRSKKVRNFMISVISIAAIILYGARGPLLSIGFFIIIRFVFDKKKTLKKYIVIMLLLLFFVIGIFFYDNILMFISNLLDSKGINSRTIRLFLSDNLLHHSGRKELFEYYLSLVKQKPIMGWGIVGGWIGEGSGPHNMLIEFLTTFGVFVGGILCFIAILLIFRMFFIKDPILKDLVTIYCSSNIVLYFISGNFLTKVNLFIFVVLCFSEKITIHKLNNKINKSI